MKKINKLYFQFIDTTGRILDTNIDGLDVEMTHTKGKVNFKLNRLDKLKYSLINDLQIYLHEKKGHIILNRCLKEIDKGKVIRTMFEKGEDYE